MSTMVNLGIGFQFKSSSLLEGDVKVRKCHDMLFLRNCMSRKWIDVTISFKITVPCEQWFLQAGRYAARRVK